MTIRYLYHYTDLPTVALIRRDRVIRAHPQTLYRHPLGAHAPEAGPTMVTEPIVWLSSNPVLEMTTVVKLLLAMREGPALPGLDRLAGRLCRLVLPDRYGGDLGLGEYTEQVGIDYEWWAWVVRTGEMAGSNYTTWRVVPGDIPLGDVIRVEVLDGLTASGGRWRVLEAD